jgi:APA family basic amino acid/polyamine antiporter
MSKVAQRKPVGPLVASEKPGVLLRQLGVFSATALVVSNMVGIGIFATSGFLAGDLGDPALVLIIWLVGAVFALIGAFCYSELGVNFPSSGGEYVYLTRAYGPTWGFMTGWVSFFAGFSGPIAAAALIFSDYLGYFFPALKQENAPYTIGSGAFSLKLGGAQLMASALIAGFTLLNFFGVRRVARIQNVLTATKILVLLAFIGLGFLMGSGSWDHFSMPTARTSTTPLVAQFAISLFWIYVAYSGWNAATYVAEELKQPHRTLPAALAVGAGLVAALYVGLNLIFIYSTPLEDMKGVLAVGALAASRLFGAGIAGIFSALMALSLVSTVNAMVTIGPRVYYAMAKNGAFLPVAAKVDPRWHTPVAAILLQGLCAMLMTLTPFPDLIIYIGFTLNFFAVMSVSSLFIFRRRPQWQKLRVVSFGFPLLPATFLLVGGWMTIYGMMLRPIVSLAAVATVAAGAAVYHFRISAARRLGTTTDRTG